MTEPIPFDTVRVSTVDELDKALQNALPNIDVLIMSAAVSDFKVANPTDEKMKKIGEKGLELSLEQTKDLLRAASAWLRSNRPNCQIVGFAAETAQGNDDLERLGRLKLESKGCDVLVANNVSHGAVFDSDSTQALVITKESNALSVSGSKADLADRVLDVVVSRLR